MQPAVGGTEVPARCARGQFRFGVAEEAVVHRERLEEPLASHVGQRRAGGLRDRLGEQEIPVARVQMARSRLLAGVEIVRISSISSSFPQPGTPEGSIPPLGRYTRGNPAV